MADLRPMGVGEILDGALTIYRRHFITFVALATPLPPKTGGPGALVAIALIGGAAWLATFVACGYGVTTQVVVLEPLGSSFDAFGRSWDLTRDRKLKVLGLALVAFILVAVPSVGIGALAAALRFSASSWASVLLVLAAVLPLILTPVLPCVFTLMYYDLRVRRGGLPLELPCPHPGGGGSQRAGRRRRREGVGSRVRAGGG